MCQKTHHVTILLENNGDAVLPNVALLACVQPSGAVSLPCIWTWDQHCATSYILFVQIYASRGDGLCAADPLCLDLSLSWTLRHCWQWICLAGHWWFFVCPCVVGHQHCFDLKISFSGHWLSSGWRQRPVPHCGHFCQPPVFLLLSPNPALTALAWWVFWHTSSHTAKAWTHTCIYTLNWNWKCECGIQLFHELKRIYCFRMGINKDRKVTHHLTAQCWSFCELCISTLTCIQCKCSQAWAPILLKITGSVDKMLCHTYQQEFWWFIKECTKYILRKKWRLTFFA